MRGGQLYKVLNFLAHGNICCMTAPQEKQKIHVEFSHHELYDFYTKVKEYGPQARLNMVPRPG